jgi:transposase
MRYELSDYEWTAIKPMLPNKPRGVRRVNDRRVLSGIFWVLRSGAPWRDLPETYGPRTTCYNRFVRWRRAGVWDRIMDALAAGHDAAVQMIDTSIVRVHQHGACISDNNHQAMGRSEEASRARFTRWSTPMVCRSISRSRPVKCMIIGCVRFSSGPCSHKRCYSRIVGTTRTGSGSLPASKEHGRTFRRNEIAKTRSASARICIARGT